MLGKKTGGRQAGTPNKTSSQLKDMIMQALEDRGGVEYLKTQALENPKTFLLLLGRVLPMSVSNDDENPFRVEVTEIIRKIIDPVNDSPKS